MVNLCKYSSYHVLQVVLLNGGVTVKPNICVKIEKTKVINIVQFDTFRDLLDDILNFGFVFI